MNLRSRYFRFGLPIVLILGTLGYLAATGIQQSKSYYVTVTELRGMGNDAYVKRLRVAGIVVAGSIQRHGTGADFVLDEQGKQLKVEYKGSEPPPDTFKDESQALAEGTMGRDGIFHASELQAKCASKYAPAAGQQSTGTSTRTQSTPPISSSAAKPAGS
jgi:cytochrome c-type biogenesis protein CcmE